MKKERKNVFIVIEGVDGVGKSTCSKILSKMLSGYYYETPPSFFTN